MTQTQPSALEPSSSEDRAREHMLLDIQGMHCAGCASRVEKTLRGVSGATGARVNLVTGQASVEFNPDEARVEDFLAAVRRGGYSAAVIEDIEDFGRRMVEKEAREASGWRRRFWVSAVLLVPLVWLTHLSRLSGPAQAWCQLLLATPIQFYVGWPYFRGAWQRLRRGTTSMDTLIALGTGVAYAAGLVEFVRILTAAGATAPGGAMYFADAGMILTFITFGKYLELKAKGRASSAIRRLLDLSPLEATVLRDDRPERIPVRAVMVGETILVRPGEKVPLDAEVISGSSAVDQSWLTGESIPIDRQAGDTILAGTINGQGSLTAKVLKPAGQTALAQVIELVRHAQESKTDVGRIADRIVAWFVPVVLTLALLTFLVWALLAGNWSLGLACTVAVLVAACPCAMGLATPAAVLVGSGRGAECGILIKEAHALETAGKLTTVVLDKTGTVTVGRPKVAAVEPADGVSTEEMLGLAAAAERLSQHPLGEAIVAEAESRNVDIPLAEHLELMPGQGIRARLGDTTIFVGNLQLAATAGIGVEGISERIDALRHRGHTPLVVAADQRLLGLISLSDPVAPHSREAIENLKSLGLEIHLVSGDHRATVEAVAVEVGIREVVSGVLPQEKQAVVARLQAAGKVVAMVGDGINDAPALATADMGVAIGSGSDVAIESADVVLVDQDLRALVRAVLLSRATLKTIWQNLGWAFVYNLLLLPVAAGLLIPLWGLRLPPAAAAAAMAASSVSVVTNSLLLRRRKLIPRSL